MKSELKKYLLYISIAIGSGFLLFVLVQTVRAKNTGFEVKTLWDWMQLFIIPLFLTGGALYLNRSERESERQRAEERSKLEREIAADRQQEAALQAYLDRMADLLLKEKMLTSKNSEVSDLARIRTLTVLRALDSKRKRIVLLFLKEAGLIAEQPIINMSEADLSNADLCKAYLATTNLSGANLTGADLSGSSLGSITLRKADLSKANLSGADMNNANLSGATLRGADLSIAHLGNADLTKSVLSAANMESCYLGKADLDHAFMRAVDLRNADLSEANLSKADLRDANLTGATVTNEQLAVAGSLKNTIMPDGTKLEG